MGLYGKACGMLRVALIGALLTTPVAVANASSELEDQLWAFASQVGSVDALQSFIERFPDSERIPEATALLAAFEENESRRLMEDHVFNWVGDVTFTDPLLFGNARIIGSSLEQIIAEGKPMFPPFPDLPDELWKGQTCSNCHSWTRENLCTQAKNYLKQEPTRYQVKKHPFDGALKINLRFWAKGDCQ